MGVHRAAGRSEHPEVGNSRNLSPVPPARAFPVNFSCFTCRLCEEGGPSPGSQRDPRGDPAARSSDRAGNLGSRLDRSYMRLPFEIAFRAVSGGTKPMYGGFTSESSGTIKRGSALHHPVAFDPDRKEGLIVGN